MELTSRSVAQKDIAAVPPNEVAKRLATPSRSAVPTVESYATLINKRLLVPTQKTNYLAIETFFLTGVLRSWVETIRFDSAWYVQHYPDVQVAIDKGMVKDASEHFVLHGYYEHRLPYKITVDEVWYLAQNDDVRAAVDAGTFPSGQAHFDFVGYREGRLPYAGFSLKVVT